MVRHRSLEVPLRAKDSGDLRKTIESLEAAWDAHAELIRKTRQFVSTISKEFKLDEPDSRLRWLASKPPE
jgi:hypothetical protein